MECLRIALLVVYLICVVPRQSHGSFHEFFRNLALAQGYSTTPHQEMSPSPSPVPAVNLDSGNAQSPVTQPTCDKQGYNKCNIKNYNVTACGPFAGIGSQASYVLVLNDGVSSQKLSIIVRPANITLEDTVTPGHVKKVDLPPNLRGASSILLNVGNGECVIHLGTSIPRGFYTGYLTPMNGTYLLFVAALFIGGTWACCIVVKRRRHLGGIPYRELEMEQQNSSSTFAIETDEGWDGNWDDERDEEKAERSPGSKDIGKVSENGASLKYIDTDQWGNDWDD